VYDQTLVYLDLSCIVSGIIYVVNIAVIYYYFLGYSYHINLEWH